MDLQQILNNLKANQKPLILIGVFAVVFLWSVVGRRDSTDELKGDSIELVIAFHKRDRPAKTYFEDLQLVLNDAFEESNYTLTFDSGKDIKGILSGLRDGTIDIAGELSPIEYSRNSSRYNFKALVSIEYDDHPFYRSVLFVPGDAPPIAGHSFRSVPGNDNLSALKKLVAENHKLIAHGNDEESASGYYYPRSYLIKHEINLNRARPLPDAETIYKEVLAGLGNNLIAGFMADFQLKKIVDSLKAANTAISEGRGTEEDQSLIKEYEGCGRPLIIDRSDPIPHGVFVISNTARRRSDIDVEKVVGLWKTAVPVEMGSGLPVKAWRSDVCQDFKIVERHIQEVDYARQYTEYYEITMTIFIAVIVILLVAVACIFLRMREV